MAEMVVTKSVTKSAKAAKTEGMALLVLPCTITTAIGEYLAHCRARRFSERTLEVTSHALRLLAGHLDTDGMEDVTRAAMRGFIVDQLQRVSAASVARYYGAIGAFWKFCVQEGYVEVNPMVGVCKPKSPQSVIEPLTETDTQAMVDACGTDFIGLRDRLLLLVLLDSGLRASELCGLEIGDIDHEEGTFIIRHGKGDKARRVPYGKTVASTLRNYLSRRGKQASEALFVNVYGAGLNRFRVREIVIKLATKAGLTRKVCAHMMRHSFAVSYLRAGGNVFALQKTLGHSTLEMSRRYSELADSDLIEMHRTASPADRLDIRETNGRKRIR